MQRTDVVLANRDYGPASTDGAWGAHTSTEGRELQEGLGHAGWVLTGPGFDGRRNVEEIIQAYKPERIFIQDVRDWLPDSNISFRKDIGFEDLVAIRRHDIPSFTVLKDAWGWEVEQAGLANLVNPRGIFCYYRLDMIQEVAPWARHYPLKRMHHTIDAELIERRVKARALTSRKPAVVSGNVQSCYPIREVAFDHPEVFNIDTIAHPGYGNRGADTPRYLEELIGYKVHLATASRWSCAFRKIIESVACAMIPITNLTKADVLPEIDGALVRIPEELNRMFMESQPHNGIAARASYEACTWLRDLIADQVRIWRLEERLWWAERAWAWYDWHVSGERLSERMRQAA